MIGKGLWPVWSSYLLFAGGNDLGSLNYLKTIKIYKI